MRLTKTLGMAGALILSAVVGGTLIGSALATDETTDDGMTTTIGGEYCQTFLDELAAELGTTRDGLTEAGRAAALATVDAAVGVGDISEERAATMRERIETVWETPSQESTEASPDEVPAEADARLEVEEVFGIIRIPRLGDDWEWIVVDDVDLGSLTRGPGHYPQSARPGELGNLAIAGHRSGHGAPFQDLDQLQVGDTIEIEQADGVWTYRIDQAPTVIDPSDVWVVDPVPGAAAEAEPPERRVTLTTCHPRHGSSQRMFVSGVLTSGEEI